MNNTVIGSYETTFNSRGSTYDQAMRDFPHARKQEFETLLRIADLKDGDKVCDLPSGGGYLEDYIKQTVDLTLLETSRVFYEQSLKIRSGNAVLTTENIIPFGDNHFDKILSLAGLHHNSNKDAFFAECARCLQPGGALCIGDVHEQSAIVPFLNTFVDQYSEEGHEGVFLGEQSLAAIEKAGLRVEFASVISYPWCFSSKADLVNFCTMLFGLTRASAPVVLQGITSYIGIDEHTDFVNMNWQLYFIRAIKPAA